MIARRANLGRALSDDDMAAVSAFPHFHRGFFENFRRFDVFQQRAISFFVVFLDRSDKSEFRRKLREAFFFGCFCKARIHIRPFVVFARRRGNKVFRCVSDAVKFLEPKFGVFFFVVGGFQKQGRDLFIALFFATDAK